MNILGISCYYHDAAAVLLKDGEVLAAAEEERFSRKKHDSSFPKNAIDFCLEIAHVSKSDLDYVVFYEKPFRKFHRMLISAISTYPLSYASFREGIRVWLTQKLWIKQEISSYVKVDLSKILFCDHHLSHAASCFYPSLFKKSAILTLDGVGEWTTSSFGVGEGSKLRLNSEIRFPQSLGLFYSAFTAFLGFEVNEGEWKLMGLAPYGKPIYADKIWKTVRQLADGSFSLDFSYFSFQYSDKKSFSEKLVKLLGSPIDPNQSHLVEKRPADIASSVQLVTEELILGMAKYVRNKTKSDNLCLAGGVALNSVANYRILKESGFKNIFVQPAAGDSGGAMGAALYAYHHVLNKGNRKMMTHAYLGKQYDNPEIEKFLKEKKAKFKKLNDKKIVDFIADKISKGRVIGWMQGRFEWGPRALGARSILADARNLKMKDIINRKVKFREAFRPFAPSVLAEYADKIFDLSAMNTSILTTGDAKEGSQTKMYRSLGYLSGRTRKLKLENHYPLRYMLYVVPVKKEWQKKVPAINHADNTARPQLVYEKENPLYYQLIKSFYKKTGVPLVLNTSFNLRGEPIVASPADAYSTLERSGIDILVMGNYVCEK
ncbi:hypothetical protein HY029_06100 [Candidatus Gottesmanbacteria bacterium]|nr:hypothetical protein [Candidatus Gottesmanbacteria bacterium]